MANPPISACKPPRAALTYRFAYTDLTFPPRLDDPGSRRGLFLTPPSRLLSGLSKRIPKLASYCRKQSLVVSCDIARVLPVRQKNDLRSGIIHTNMRLGQIPMPNRSALKNKQWRALGRKNEHYATTADVRFGPGSVLPLDDARDGHRLHGDGREPAIWLDAVRRSDRCEISLGPRGDSARLHAVRGDRDLARAGRSLVRR